MSVPKRTAEQINFCDSLNDLWDSQSKWSQATFGSDFERGPIGALKHLELEAREAYEAYGVASGNYHEELADCFLLLMDACRRSGLSIQGLVSVARAKHEVNKKRKWSKPTTDNPVKHVKDKAGRR